MFEFGKKKEKNVMAHFYIASFSKECISTFEGCLLVVLIIGDLGNFL